MSLLKQERNVLTHSGGTAGYNTFVAVDPERRLGVVVLRNQLPVVLTDQLPHATRIGLHLLDRRIPAGSPRSSAHSGYCQSCWRCSSSLACSSRGAEPVHQVRSILAAAVMTLGLTVWMAGTYVAASFRFLQFPPGSPTMVVVFALLIVLSVGLGLSPVGRRLAAGLPLAVLVGVQGFRLPLELLMHRAYEEGLMPEVMSYTGLNFDIVTGITALIVGALLALGRAGLRTVRAWNVIGTCSSSTSS